MKRPLHLAAAFALGLLITAGAEAGPTALGPLWADIQVAEPGLHECVLPPALHSLGSGGGLDLLLLGPDGQARSVELFWAQGGEGRSETLQAKSYSLKQGAFVWEADLPSGWDLESLDVQAAQQGFSGKLRVELRGPGTNVLATDRALFDGQPVHLDLPAPAHGSSLRLTLSGMDQRFRAEAKLLGQVQAGLRRPGQALQRRELSLPVQVRSLDEDGRAFEEAAATLPGSGLFIERLDLRTRQALIGTWRLGQERLQAGRPAFVQQSQGAQRGLSAQGRDLALDVNARWNGRDLRLRLDNQGRRTGVERLQARVRLPRLAFEADRAGTYTLVAGSGRDLPVQERPAAALTGAVAAPVGPVQQDAGWRPESLAARYALQGGPLNEEGFTWNAVLPVPSPGYWRVSLPAALQWQGGLEGLRLGLNGAQVPFFILPTDPQTVSLTARTELDARSNVSLWTLSLPQASSAWQSVSLKAHGVFHRNVQLTWRRPQAPVWQPLGTLDWTSRGGESRLELPLGAWSREGGELRLRIDHGDNKALALDAAEAAYRCEDLAFVVDKAAELTLWGGKPGAVAGRYDLDLLRQDLMGQEPGRLRIESVRPVQAAPWYNGWSRFKAGSELWFYIALALVTAGLLALIAKLLPRI